ncbi:uncharacterized protein LOC593583 [Strongylocentrotus purpuratus]|uniref:Peptidase S8/S53 domain-containing protein n=1 Tax=Strongylocentrotus purpuratus TaxID=7668 RepID=A0A7M7RFE0_STRPU|nr:uncharacterized protein LOC593583 [Strongylocentrotus purpuratus]|eukprot:XP_798146.3 PREDICTED: proteinase K [Strongylocentrotus purpuratus]
MKLLLLFVCLVAALSTSHAGSKSSSDSGSGSCSCEDEIEDQITNVYIITAKDEKDLKKLIKKIGKKKDCEDATIKSEISSLMFAATVRMSPDCAEEVNDWGYVIEPNAVQFTDEFDEPWNRDRIDQVDLPLDMQHFETSGGEGTTIFIMDTGVRVDHTEFNGRAEYYRDMLASDPTNPETGDPNGHGTRCAGAAIGATIGVATKANVKSIRVAGPTGSGSIEQSLLGFEEVEKWTIANPGAKCVVSYSLSSHGISTSLDTAVAKLSQKCVVVISAGNYGQDPETADACKYSPGRAPEAITVGAARLRQGATVDDKAGFSCSGSCLTLYAPGHKVTVASSVSVDGVVTSSGTSFSAPAVAGAAAVLLSNGYDIYEVKDVIRNTAIKNKLSGLPAGDETNLLLNVQNSAFHQPKP